MPDITETAKKIRVALRAAFPKTKISVTSHGSIDIAWEDTGPPLDALKTALVAAGLAQPRSDFSPDHLKADGYSLWFDCYNAAERAVRQLDFERRRQDWDAQERRARDAIDQARAAKRSAFAAAPFRQTAPETDSDVFAAFERLRLRAEAQAADGIDKQRRPTWAPPLILGEELDIALGHIASDEKGIGRLWAQFATPKRSGRYLRENVSKHTLHGISCRGFQLFAGGERGNTSDILFEAQRVADGTWQFGPWWFPSEYRTLRAREWESLIREREGLRYEIEHRTISEERALQVNEHLAAIKSKIASIDAQDAAGAEIHRARQSLKQRALELARARVLDFVGAPDAQMQAAGRLCGQCCRCWKVLTDPISLERGIGPDCHAGMVAFIRQLAAEDYPVDRISLLVGASIEFIAAVLGEVEQRPRNVATENCDAR